MARKGNASDGVPLRITISKQSAELLERLAGMGLYGRNPPDVAARFVEKALEAFIAPPKFHIDGEGKVGDE